MSGSIRASRPVIIARWLVVASFVAMLFSPPATNLLQVSLFALCLSSSTLRSRLWAARSQPLVAGAMLFALVLFIGATYSFAGPREGFASLGSWRKLMMLPIAAALFTDANAKMQLLRIVVTAFTLTAIASFIDAWVPGLARDTLNGDNGGVLARNYVTQGLYFSMAALGAASMALFRSMGEPLARRRLWAGAALLLATNVLLVLPGRSGYLALLVGAVALVIGWSASRRLPVVRASLLVMGAVGIIFSLIALTPTARQRVELAVKEMHTYAQATEGTSMGLRMFFWQNTVQLIRERPILGWGTGGFEKAYSQRIAGQVGPGKTVTGDPHNQFMKIAAEQGLLGLAVFLGFLAMALCQRTAMHFRLLGLGALATWCATSMANSHFSTFSEGTFLYLWLGTMLAPQHSDSSSTPGSA